MSTARINLDDFRSEDKVRHVKAKVFTGRDRGQEVREKSRIDELEKNNDEVIIEIPADIYSINPSFFEELFFNVVTKLKKEAFLNKFKSQCICFVINYKLTGQVYKIIRKNKK